jgi:hypothetical protein
MREFNNGVLTVTREDGAVLELPVHPSRQSPWESEEEALNFPITDKYPFIKYDAEFIANKKDELLRALAAYAKKYFKRVMVDYSEWEAVSWPFLIQEALKFKLDGTVGEYMQEELGVKYPNAGTLADIILYRADFMRSLRAGIILTRQSKEQEINSCSTIKELNELDLSSGWPE